MKKLQIFQFVKNIEIRKSQYAPRALEGSVTSFDLENTVIENFRSKASFWIIVWHIIFFLFNINHLIWPQKQGSAQKKFWSELGTHFLGSDPEPIGTHFFGSDPEPTGAHFLSSDLGPETHIFEIRVGSTRVPGFRTCRPLLKNTFKSDPNRLTLWSEVVT